MIFSRLGLLGLTVILASSCATLERLVPNESAEDKNQAQELELPASVKLISENELKKRESNLQAKQNATSKEQNTELKKKILSLEAQLLRQEKAFAELQGQWTTNFSLMEKAVSETLRENQQLIAELQQSVEAMPNTMVASEKPPIRQASTPSQVTPKPITPKLLTSPNSQATTKTLINQPPSIPVVEEVSLASLQQKPKPPPLPEVNALIQKEEKGDIPDQAPQTNLTLEEFSNGSQTNAAEVVDKNKLNTAEIFEDLDLNEPVQPLALQRRPGIKKLYNQGMSAFIQGDYPEAVDVFEGFVEEFEDDVDSDNAYYWIGYSQFKLGKWDAAESAFRKVLQNYEHRPTSQGFKTPDAIYMLGKLAETRKQPERAAYYFKNVLENYPGSAAANNAQEDLRTLR
ncbi:MAG: tetratricopeptide repeat protein [SAR324 cluster bacterium]|nr:tetratricopeptide repeat protein [SAR324 cluster bacterium]